MTWESSSSLPQKLIDEFEEGIVYDESIETDMSYGVTNYMVIARKRKNATEPPLAKQAKVFLTSDTCSR